MPDSFTPDSSPADSFQADTPAQDHTTFTGALKNFWNKVNPLTSGTAIVQTAQHPVQAAEGYSQQNQELLDAAHKAFQRGGFSGNVEGIRHGISYLLNGIPGVGEAIDEAGNKAQAGDYLGAASDTAALVTNLLAPELAGRGLSLASKALPAAKTAATEVTGATTGVGAAPIRRALENPSSDLVDAMRGNLSEGDVLKNFQNAVQDVRDARAADYQARLKTMPSGAGSSIDISPIKRQLSQKLDQFGVKVQPDGSLDFSRSTVSDASAQRVIQDTYDDVTGWGKQAGDRTPLGVDTLARRIADRYTPNGQARAFIQSMKDTTSQTIGKQVPGYAAMKQGYAQASEFLDHLKDLSLESSNPGTAVRKLTTTLRQNNAYRQVLVDQLSQFTGKDLTGQLAGLNLSKMGPQGLARAIDTGAGLLAAVAHGTLNPTMAVGVAAASPRLMGELMVAMNKARPALAAAAKAIPAAAGASGAGNLLGQATALQQ